MVATVPTTAASEKRGALVDVGLGEGVDLPDSG